MHTQVHINTNSVCLYKLITFSSLLFSASICLQFSPLLCSFLAYTFSQCRADLLASIGGCRLCSLLLSVPISATTAVADDDDAVAEVEIHGQTEH